MRVKFQFLRRVYLELVEEIDSKNTKLKVPATADVRSVLNIYRTRHESSSTQLAVSTREIIKRGKRETEDEQEEEAPPVMLGALSVTTATIFTLSSFSSSVRAVLIFWQRYGMVSD